MIRELIHRNVSYEEVSITTLIGVASVETTIHLHINSPPQQQIQPLPTINVNGLELSKYQLIKP